MRNHGLMTQDTFGDFVRESRHVSVWVDAAPATVYDYTVDPGHLPAWVAGLNLDGADFAFVARNDLGVLDHTVRVDGQVFYNPMRVLPSGSDATTSELVFTVRRRAGMTDAEFDADAAAVQADLATLKGLVEG
jgi:hypothetical protein